MFAVLLLFFPFYTHKNVDTKMLMFKGNYIFYDDNGSTFEPRREKTEDRLFCICESEDADQLRGNHEADQSLCFCYIDSTIPLLSKS